MFDVNTMELLSQGAKCTLRVKHLKACLFYHGTNHHNKNKPKVTSMILRVLVLSTFRQDKQR